MNFPPIPAGALSLAEGQGPVSPLILIVDDQPEIRSLLARLLRREGFEVIEEMNGLNALDSARLLRPDLILLDVMMPDMDGFEVCRILKSKPETRLLPVVLLTGLGVKEHRVKGLEAGADEFLTKPADREELLARVRSLLRIKSYTDQLVGVESVVLSLARSIEGKDPTTEGHCERLAEYGVLLGERMGLNGQALEALSQAGFLHDIGKVGVPDAILLKKGPLTPEEWVLMKKHPVLGEHICCPIDSFRRVLPIIRHHHERGDGSGYPDGLRSEEIPLEARVLQIVDVFDALTSPRPYKKALTSQAALEVMEREVAKGWWDPKCFQAFRSLLSDRPLVFHPADRLGEKRSRQALHPELQGETR